MSTKVETLNQGNSKSQILNVILWIVQLGTAAMFFMAGGNKLAGNPQMVGLYEAIGIGQWFRYLTGVMEVSGALLLLIPALSGVGGLALTGVMLGAVATHLFVIGGDPTMAFAMLAASIVIAVGRKDRTLSLIGR